MICIYKITNPTGRIYIGKTVDLRKRINCHKHSAKSNKNFILYNSIKKYGWDAHVISVIEECEETMLDQREMFWIKELNTYCQDNPNGMNMTKGGEGQRSSWMHKTELRGWFSKRFTGEGNPFFGKKHTKEFCERKSKEVSEYNIKNGKNIPKWGVEKGRLKVIRAVICYDKYGNYLNKYDSIRQASNILNVNHSSVFESCNKIITAVKGTYIFRYYEPNFPLKIDVPVVKVKTDKRAVFYLDKSFDVIKEYESAFEASLDLNIPKTTINRAAMYNNLKPIRKGHIFIYKDLYNQTILNNRRSLAS